MYARQITSEQMYTLSEAKRIINREKRQKMENLLYKIRQKAVGILAIGISVAELVMGYCNLIDEGGISIIMLPVGIWLLFTSKNII